MTRPRADDYFLDMARLIATRGTCRRRKVGCVLVNSRRHVLATGYNGVPSGFYHCTDAPCPGADYVSGEGLDKCEATHAEQNALLQCHDVHDIHTAYITCAPCVHCVKLLLNTSCKRIVFGERYTPQAEELWKRVPIGAKRDPIIPLRMNWVYREWINLGGDA